MSRSMKDSGVAWIGEMPKEWSLIRFKDRYSNIKEIAGDAADEYERLALTLNGVIKRAKDDSEGLQPKEFNGYQILRENDFVFKMIDLQNISTSRVGLSTYEGLVSPAYIRFSPRNENQNNKFMYYYLMSLYYNCVYNNMAGDGVRSALNAKDLGQIWCPVPDDNTQGEIVSCIEKTISKLETLLENQYKQLEKLKLYRKAIITEVTTKGLDLEVITKENSLANCSVPEHWEDRKIMTLLSMRVIDGPHESPILQDDGIPYISATAIVNGKIDFSLMRGYISEEYCDLCDQRYKPQIDDILVIKLGASTGQVAIVETEKRFNIWVPLAAVRCDNKKAIPKFIYYAFQSDYFIKQMELSWTFGTQQTLGVKTIEQLRVLLPTIDEQLQIVNYLDMKCCKIDALIAIKEKKIEKLNQYKKSIIYEYVTGKKEA